MRVEGSYTIKADRDTVWASLLSPDLLASCIPGCEKLEPLEDDNFEVQLRAGVGPVRASYTGLVTLSDKVEPESYKMLVSGRGSAGTVEGEGALTLVEGPGETRIDVVGEAQVAGTVARVGQRLLGSASKMIMNQFFACVKEKIEGSGQ